MRYISARFINMILRSTTIALKFLLSIVVIKMLSIEDYGVFGLFQSTIIIMTFVLGLDFYAFSSREILKVGAKEFSFYFKNQLLLHLITYVLIIPISFLIFKFGIVDFKYLNLFYFILISEHISQELYRLLILLKKTVSATIVLFLRSGFWIIILYVIWSSNIIVPTINSIFYLWLLGAFISILFGFKYINFKWTKGIDMVWIIRGIKIAFPFFVGTILYKLIEFSGRYFLNFYFSAKEVGVYTFFSGVANILFVFVQTIVIIEIYPRLVESKNIGNSNFTAIFRLFKKQTKQFTAFGFALSVALIYPLLFILDKTILFDYLISYFILLISTVLFCFSFIPHYALYSYNQDINILKATGLAFMFNLIFSFLLIPQFGVLGAALSQMIAFLLMLFIKSRFWKKFNEAI